MDLCWEACFVEADGIRTGGSGGNSLLRSFRIDANFDQFSSFGYFSRGCHEYCRNVAKGFAQSFGVARENRTCSVLNRMADGFCREYRMGHGAEQTLGRLDGMEDGVCCAADEVPY